MAYSDFRTAYIEALLWSSIDCRGDGDCSCADCKPFDSWADESDFAPETLESIEADCRAFYDAHGDSLEEMGDSVFFHHYDKQAGHDFLLTRNRHGSGFWDGDWPTDLGWTLTNAAQAFGDTYIYTGDDGMIYV